MLRTNLRNPCSVLLAHLVAVSAFAQVPSIDSVFATNGQLQTPFPFTVTEVNTERLLALSDGHFLGVGSAVVPGFDIQGVVTKYDVCGVPDPSFGNNGSAFVSGGGGWQMKFDGAAELADGSLLIHGTSAQGFGAYSSNRPTLVRLSADGQVDASYGTDGLLLRSFPDGISCGFGTHLIALPDGKYLSATCWDNNANGGAPGLSLFRYRADGAPDTTFASGGAVHISKSVAAPRAEAHVVGDTTILVAYGSRSGDFGQFIQIELNAFDTAGNYENTFGIGGLLADTTLFGGNGRWGFSSVMDDQNRLVVFGTTFAPDGNNAFLVIRFLPNGARDLSFGENGRALVPKLSEPNTGNAFAARMKCMQDGTILCIGHISGQGGIMDTQWFRLTSDGTLVPGTNEVLPTDLHAYQISDMLGIDNGRLLAQARSQSPAPIGQVQLRFADPAVVMPHIALAGPSLEVSGTGPFQWQLDGNDIGGATGASFTPTQNGTYTVESTDVFGCTGTSAPFELTNVGIASIDDEHISVIGPDAHNRITVRTKEPLRYTIMDASGAQVGSGVVGQGVIDVGSLATGTYLLVLGNEQQRRTVRFAKH